MEVTGKLLCICVCMYAEYAFIPGHSLRMVVHEVIHNDAARAQRHE